MAEETRKICYGDKEFELDAGMTIDQAKSIMARHFPELADPEIKTEKKGDVTTYTFSKRAGRKGADRVDVLLSIPPAPVLPDDVVQFAGVLLRDDITPQDTEHLHELASRLREDSHEAQRLAAALANLKPSQKLAWRGLL